MTRESTPRDLPERKGRYALYDGLSLMIDSLDNLHALDKHGFLGHAFEAAFGLIPEAEKGSLYELQDGMYRPVFARGYDFSVLSRIEFSPSNAFIDFDIREGEPIRAYETRIEGRDPGKFSPQTMEAFRLLGTLGGFDSLYAPIQVDGVTRGIISLEKFGSGGFKRLSRKVLQYYARLISEFYAQRLYQERQTMLYKDVVSALVSAIDVMDRYTEGHAQRVSAYSERLARRLGLPPADVDTISTAALLHDVGKLGVPSEVIRKRGTLNPDEQALMRQHPVHSAKILGAIHGFEDIAELAKRHHERWDGTGYPDGLEGRAIPIGSQIIQLADSFDAMTSSRSYRPALSLEEAFGEIRGGMGGQFHPEVADAALAEFADEDTGHRPHAEPPF